MGKVGRCLKRSYIIVASFVAIISGLLLAITLFTHGYFQEDEELEKFISGLHAMYVISIITLILTIFGVYGACKKKQWALILFTVGIILSSLFMITCEIQGLAVQPQMAKELKKQYLHMLPLDNATEAFVDGLKEVQMELQCCGLDQGYLDWGHDIPESCLCTEETTNPCVAAPRDSSLFEHTGDDQPIMIYKESCLPYLIEHEMITLNTALGIMLGVTLLWPGSIQPLLGHDAAVSHESASQLILSVVLCIAILCQLSRKEDTPTVVYSSEAKAGNYTALADAAEYT